MTKPSIPQLAPILLLCALASAADKPNTSEILFEATPKAAPYVHEIDGNLAITFVHDIDIKKFSFAAVAEKRDGKTVGNWNHASAPAPENVPPLVRVIHDTTNEIGPLSTATITFHDLPLAQVKSVKIFILSETDPIPHTTVKLPAYFGPPPAAAKPLTLTSTPDPHTGSPIITTSAGLTLTSTSCATRSSGGILLDAWARTATVTNQKGELILKAPAIDLQADAPPPAAAPAPKP